MHIEFPDDSLSFNAGFELGMIYVRLQLERAPVEITIHCVNHEALESLALATGFRPVWGKVSPTPHGMDVVDVTMERSH